jgi:hypothetical protein
MYRQVQYVQPTEKREKKKENLPVPNPIQMRLYEVSDPTQRQVQIIQTKT